MSKGKGMGIAVAVIALAIVFGIASIPDEVLLESPNVDTSEIENTNIPVPVIDEPVGASPVHPIVVEASVEPTPEEIPIEVIEEPIAPIPEETPIVVEETKETIPVESESEKSNGNGQVIRVGIKDGIGSGDR